MRLNHRLVVLASNGNPYSVERWKTIQETLREMEGINDESLAACWERLATPILLEDHVRVSIPNVSYCSVEKILKESEKYPLGIQALFAMLALEPSVLETAIHLEQERKARVNIADLLEAGPSFSMLSFTLDKKFPTANMRMQPADLYVLFIAACVLDEGRAPGSMYVSVAEKEWERIADYRFPLELSERQKETVRRVPEVEGFSDNMQASFLEAVNMLKGKNLSDIVKNPYEPALAIAKLGLRTRSRDWGMDDELAIFMPPLDLIRGGEQFS